MRGIYATAPNQPDDKSTVAFLTWITSNGGPALVSAGYSDLTSLQKQANIEALLNIGETERSFANNEGLAGSLSWLIVLGIVVAAGIIIAVVTLILAGMRNVKADEIITITPAFNENTVLRPNGLFMTGRIHGLIWRRTGLSGSELTISCNMSPEPSPA